MDDAISRDAALELLRNNIYVTGYGYKQLNEGIKELPALDAVPVVRCKDCTWFNHGYCMRFDDDAMPDDFCSHGHVET